MAEPLLPHPSTAPDEGEVPGPDQAPATTDEPDVLDGTPEPEGTLDSASLPDTPFRTPVAGQSLSPDDLADES